MGRLCVVVLSLLLGSAATAAPSIWLGESPSGIERHAAAELQRWLYAATGELCPVVQAGAVPAKAAGFVLGTPGNLPQTGESWPFGLDAPRHDGFLLHSLPGGNLIVVAGETPEAVQHGVYALLDELGFGFYLSGNPVTERARQLRLDKLPRLHRSYSPALPLRGTLLEDTYFAGSAAWSLEDYRRYIDRLAALRMNALVIRASVDGPLAAFEGEGVSGGNPPVDTLGGAWFNQPLPTQRFLAGTGEFFAGDAFGAPASKVADRGAAIAAAKDSLRQALAHAKARGLRVELGFELRGAPDDPLAQQALERRLRTLLADYPVIDRLWLWAPETSALSMPGEPAPRGVWAAALRRWQEPLSAIAEPARRVEAARLALLAAQAKQVVSALRPDLQLVVGGDGDLGFSAFVPVLRDLLPPDTAIAALGNTEAAPDLPVARIEFDGDLWMPQPSLQTVADAFTAARAGHAQGLLGLHWRTDNLDDGAAYLARLAWDPQLTPGAYLARRARDLYGEELGPQLAPYLVRLQDLGYRWVGGLGQQQPAPFAWRRGDESQRAELTRVASDLRARLNREKALPTILPDVTAPLELGRDLLGVPFSLGRELITDPVQAGRQLVGLPLQLGRGLAGVVVPLPDEAPVPWRGPLEDLYARIRFVLAYDRAASLLGEGGAFDTYASRGETERALEVVEEAQLAEMLHLLAQRIHTKGQLGVLAELNTRAWADVRRRLGLTDAELASLSALPELYRANPFLLVLPDRVIVVGAEGRDTEVLLKVRRLGEKSFTQHLLTGLGHSAFALEFPEEFAGDSVEYGIVAPVSGRKALVWPAGFPAVTRTRAARLEARIPEAPASPALAVRAPELQYVLDPESQTVRLEWPVRPGEAYAVSRGPEPLDRVFVGWYEDLAAPMGVATYTVTATNLATGETAASEVAVPAAGASSLRPPARIDVVSRGGWNILSWRSDTPGAAAYRVVKHGPNQQPMAEARVEAAYGHVVTFADAVDPGRSAAYTVAALGPDGQPGPPSAPVGVIASPAKLEPRVQLSLQNEPTLLENLAQVGANSLALGGAGWPDLPPEREWGAGRPLTVSLWVRPDRVFGMPVLLCKGPWARPAYYLQEFGGAVRFHLAGQGTLDAGRLRPGQWQHIVATYADGELRLYLDGELVGRRQAGDGEPPAVDDRFLARYGIADEPGFVNGVLDDIRIYDAALAPEEIRTLHEQTRPE